jgi:conjugative relaxase-like TrwC/TraI family protein
MLSVYKLSLEQAKTYYSKDNYYTKVIGEMYGKGLENVGLTKDDLTHENFVHLLEGINPTTGEKMGAARTKDSVPGFDFTFSPPKSLSVVVEAAEVYNTDLAQKMLELHDKAVNATLQMIEKEHIKTRLKKNKKEKIEYTGNMIVSKFGHDLSRALDPQVHTHSVIKNITLCKDGKYRALDMSTLLQENSPIVKNIGKYYRQVLKQELLKAGVDVRVTNQKENFFELKAVKKDVIDEFSKRREEVEKEVEKLRKKHPNMSETKLYQNATLNSRNAKKEVDREKVRKDNLEALAKHTDIKELLDNVSKNVKIEEKNIDPKSIKKIINKAEKSIKNKYHKTIDNITDKAISLLPKKVNIDIEKIREIVKLTQELKTFAKEDLKELKTMHDVVKFQLRSSKFDTSHLSKKVKQIKNLEIEQKQEILEDAKSRRKSKTDESVAADKVTERHTKELIRQPKKTRRVSDGTKRKFKNFDRELTTERVRGLRRGHESKRFDVDADRAISNDTESTENRNTPVKPKKRITREDLRRDTKKMQRLREKKEEYSKKS